MSSGRKSRALPVLVAACGLGAGLWPALSQTPLPEHWQDAVEERRERILEEELSDSMLLGRLQAQRIALERHWRRRFEESAEEFCERDVRTSINFLSIRRTSGAEYLRKLVPLHREMMARLTRIIDKERAEVMPRLIAYHEVIGTTRAWSGPGADPSPGSDLRRVPPAERALEGVIRERVFKRAEADRQWLRKRSQALFPKHRRTEAPEPELRVEFHVTLGAPVILVCSPAYPGISGCSSLALPSGTARGLTVEEMVDHPGSRGPHGELGAPFEQVITTQHSLCLSFEATQAAAEARGLNPPGPSVPFPRY